MTSSTQASLRGLRTFCVAARYESFRAAADALFVTASAVSHQIKTLEEELGLVLFDRGLRKLTLTAGGQELYAELAPLLEQVDAVVGRHRAGASQQTIRISVQPFFASEYFVPRLSDFSANHPDINIYVASSDESAEKHPAGADLSIRLFSSAPVDLASERLFPLRLAPAGSQKFKASVKLQGQRIVSDFPLIVHETMAGSWQQWSDATGIALPKQPKLTRLESMIAVLRATQKGLGAALVPVPMGELWFTEGSVVRLFDQEFESDRAYYLVWKASVVESDGIRKLRQWIIETFQGDT